MPSTVADAELKALKPFMGRVIFFMKRWSCSIILFRYLTCRMSMNPVADFRRWASLAIRGELGALEIDHHVLRYFPINDGRTILPSHDG
jgi:hypothetical protein